MITGCSQLSRECREAGDADGHVSLIAVLIVSHPVFLHLLATTFNTHQISARNSPPF